MAKKTNSAQSTTGPPGNVMSAYNDLLSRAQQVGSQPYQQYSGQLLAPFSQSQQTAFNTVDQAQGIANPYLAAAQSYATQGASPISPEQIANYFNPYTQQVTQSTVDYLKQINADQLAQVKGNAIAQGALGGDRLGVAQGQVAGKQALFEAPTIANLGAQGYSQALAAAQADALRQGQAAYTFGNLGQEAQTTALTGAQAQLQTGAQQQQQAQAGLNIPYQQWQQQQAFPYQQLSWLAGVEGGIGPKEGSTTTQTTPGPNPWAQAAGLGIAAAGLFLKRGGKVKGYAGGGMPLTADPSGGISIGTTPYGAPVTWIPTPAPIFGEGLTPARISMPSDSSGIGGITQGLGGLRGAFSSGDEDLVSPVGPTYGAPKIAGQDITFGSMGGIPVPTSWARGGGISTGGSVLADDVMGSFADGGAPDFDQEFAPGEFSGIAVPSFSSGAPVEMAPTIGFGGTAQSAPLSLNAPAYTGPSRYAPIIGGMESGNNYGVLGPVTRTGDRAYGRYQVMGSNIGPWTQEVLGRTMTPDQFLNDPRAQDAVFNAKFGNYVDKYGPEGASRAWFAGERGMNNPNATDVLGTSVSDYAGRFARSLSGDNGINVPSMSADSDVLPDEAQPAQYQNGQNGHSLGLGLIPENWKAPIIAAGLGMMASRSPFLGTAIGEGGLQGVKEYENQQTRGLAQRRVDLEAQRLQQQADQFSKELQLKTKLGEMPYEKMTAAQAATVRQPKIVAQDILGHPIYGVQGPNGQWLNPVTNQPITADTLTGSAPGAAGGNTSVPPQMIDQWTKAYGDNGAKLLASYPQLVRNNVLGLINGDIDPSKLSYRDRGNYINLASAVDPSYNTYTAPMRAKAARDFATGQQGNQVRFFNNAVQHLSTLRELITGLGNGDVNVVNAAKNAFKNQFGYIAPGNFEAAKAIVGQEIVKAIVANGGGEREREEAATQLSSAKSPEQLNAIIDTYMHLMGAQLRDLKVQYDNAGLKNFEGKLIPESKAELDRILHPNQSPQMSSTDQQALAWANAHLNDPRAAQIKQRLGVQ